ncbi:hypothetical protein GBF38_004256 [Nibea albiflora]|uniref:Uncharacterized protein n=1 Tax=Nibea albiflora TaxID=240163 RepID=A0ACB7FD97_NIBAL|nr:hypothetical protein GBF38_004256 [Nibea albiflora]
MEKKQHAVKGQAEAGRVPRYQRQPQGFRQPAEFIRGPTQRTLWVPPEHCTPVREISIDVEDADFKRGPVKHKKLWTPPSRDNHQHAAAKPQQADRVNTCNQVQARPRTTIHVPQQCVNSETKPTAEPKGDDDMSYLDALNMLRQINGKTCIVVEASTQATTQVPQIEFQQPSVRETEQATTFKTEDKASAAPLEQLEKVQVEPCNEPQQAMIYVSELEHQQFQRQTDRITKLKNGNEALAAEMEQLKKMLQMNQTFHNETKQKRMDDVKDLELQLSEKKASEAEALSKVQELEKALQIQKDRRAEQDILLAQQEEDITKLKTALVQTQDELKRHQLHRQEERSALSEILREAQQVLQEGKAMQEREQQRKRVEKSPSKKGSPSSLSKLEASIPPQSNPPPNYSPSMPTTHPIITPS